MELDSDEALSQEIGTNGTLDDRDLDLSTVASSCSSDDSDLPSVLTPSVENRKPLFKRGDLIWAKHRDDWWPAVVKNVYKSRRAATIVWTDDCDRKRSLASKGFRIALNSIKPWSCRERRYFLTDGESKHGLRFENAVGMLDNFLRKRAEGSMELDVFEYLAKIPGSLYSLYDCRDEEDPSSFSPDIKKSKIARAEPAVDRQASLTSGLGEEDSEDEPFNNNREFGVENPSKSEVYDDGKRGRRNLCKEMEAAVESKNGRLERILEFLSSDECRARLRAIHEDREKSCLKVFFDSSPSLLKPLKLNNFGPFRRDEDVDRLVKTLKGTMKRILGTDTLNNKSVDYLLGVWMPEALAYSLQVLEGISFNDALAEIWWPDRKF